MCSFIVAGNKHWNMLCEICWSWKLSIVWWQNTLSAEKKLFNVFTLELVGIDLCICRLPCMWVANAREFDNSITRGNFLRSGEWMGWVGEKLEQCKDQPKYPISFLSPHKLLSKCRIRRKNVSSLDPNGNNYFNQTKPLFSINWWVTGEQDTFLSTLPPLEH